MSGLLKTNYLLFSLNVDFNQILTDQSILYCICFISTADSSIPFAAVSLWLHDAVKSSCDLDFVFLKNACSCFGCWGEDQIKFCYSTQYKHHGMQLSRRSSYWIFPSESVRDEWLYKHEVYSDIQNKVLVRILIIFMRLVHRKLQIGKLLNGIQMHWWVVRLSYCPPRA